MQFDYGSINFSTRFPDRTHIHLQSQFQPHKSTAVQVLEESLKTNQLLLFDPIHLLDATAISSPNQPTREYLGGWEKQLYFFSSRIVGVDIHPEPGNKEAVEELLRGGKLYELALASQELCANLQFLRVEALVPLNSQISQSHFQKKGIDYLTQIAEVLKSLRKMK
ncbi:MAG: hypothetical protein Q7S61_03180 [bacterium]|nr:hypothetical protein [bacterium]